jgi:serine/threonine protein kinase
VETKPDPIVIKVMGLDGSYIGIRSVGEFLMDGVVGAAVSKNPSLVDMYGFCRYERMKRHVELVATSSKWTMLCHLGAAFPVSLVLFPSLSMFSEVVWGGAIDDIVMPRGRCSKTVECMLNRTRTGPVESMNNLTSTQKLEWAYMMTQSVAALHQHPEGSIIHSDIALRQFLVTDDWKQIKLTDFNQAQILRYDITTNQTCDYISMHDYGSHRAPEVYMRKPAQAKIDVWGLGVCFYSLLTGLRTHYDVCDEEGHAVPKNVIKGVQYKIDDRWRTHSYAESVLVKAIEECSIYEPSKRITIESLLELLGSAVQENRRRREKYPPKA